MSNNNWNVWNPWHGCQKISDGCENCYVYRGDSRHGKNSMEVHINKSFDIILKRTKYGEFTFKPCADGIIYTCFTSDFFLDKADEWRDEAWRMIKIRKDAMFLIITKRIHRFDECIPKDWGEGYDNVIIGCTTENQKMADFRLPIFQKAKIKHKIIICEPLLTEIDLSPYLNNIEKVIVGGESGNNARICDYDWVLSIRKQCIDARVSFDFRQTGAYFKKDNKIYRINRKHQISQAKKANIDYNSQKV